jgi:GMP synthase (glutamine-hydrolysing)
VDESRRLGDGRPGRDDRHRLDPRRSGRAFEDDIRRLYGVQWHPEVLHTAYGQRVLENFLWRGAGLTPDWTAPTSSTPSCVKVREQVGDAAVLCALSGGVDSSVAAALVQRAVGDQLTCVFVDHGLLREGEAEQVEQDFVAATGVDLVVVDARERFLQALAGVTDPEEKRKIIGESSSGSSSRPPATSSAPHRPRDHPVEFLVQGTLYPDVVESGGGEGAANIKSHHNVGGLPDDLQFTWSSRCARCSRTRCARSGSNSGCPRRSSGASPSPGRGWASGSSAR